MLFDLIWKVSTWTEKSGIEYIENWTFTKIYISPPGIFQIPKDRSFLCELMYMVGGYEREGKNERHKNRSRRDGKLA